MTSGDAGIQLVPYDEAWPEQFDCECRVLAHALGRYVTGTIEHIGSTAVPGLVAKPVIDIMVGVDSLDESRPVISLVAPIGYCYSPYRADEEHWFCKPSPWFRTHHLHVIPFRSRTWVETIAFRDYLRRHPDVTAEYADLKRQLAEQYRHDRDAYTDAKTPFIRRTIERALSDSCGARRDAE